jgi:anti-sigma B factor antagonist
VAAVNDCAAEEAGIVHVRMDANPIVLDDTAGDVMVVAVEGEHDIYTAPTLRERLEEALARGGGIVVDLTKATFVDSSVLGALLDARRRALEAGRGFVVCVGETVEPGVQRILDITGLVPVLPVLRGREQAIETARDNGTGA